MMGECTDEGEEGPVPRGGDALRRHLRCALEQAETDRTRYHLRAALQLVEFGVEITPRE
jgi:hypothetical protein